MQMESTICTNSNIVIKNKYNTESPSDIGFSFYVVKCALNWVLWVYFNKRVEPVKHFNQLILHDNVHHYTLCVFITNIPRCLHVFYVLQCDWLPFIFSSKDQKTCPCSKVVAWMYREQKQRFGTMLAWSLFNYFTTTFFTFYDIGVLTEKKATVLDTIPLLFNVILIFHNCRRQFGIIYNYIFYFLYTLWLLMTCLYHYTIFHITYYDFLKTFWLL